MKMFRIETYTNEVKESTVSVPLALATIAIKPFLSRIMTTQKDVILAALEDKTFLGVILELDDHASGERVIFSVS